MAFVHQHVTEPELVTASSVWDIFSKDRKIANEKSVSITSIVD